MCARGTAELKNARVLYCKRPRCVCSIETWSSTTNDVLLVAGALLALPSIEADAGLGATLSPDRLGWIILIIGIPLASALVAWLSARMAVRFALNKLP